MIGLFSVAFVDDAKPPPPQQTPANVDLTPSLAVGSHVAATPIAKKAAASSLLRASMSGRKAPNKRSRLDSSLESASSEQSQFAELAKGSHKYKMAQLELKRQKMELQIEKERESQQFASQERSLAMKQKMQEKDLIYKTRLMQYELELARLRGGQVPMTSGVQSGVAQEGHGFSMQAYPSNTTFSQDTFTFGTDTTTTLPSLPPITWDSSEVSATNSLQ